MTTPLEIIREAVIKVVPEIGANHLFEPGNPRCIRCDVPMLWEYRRPLMAAIVDEKSGGSYQEIEATQHDERGKPCSGHVSRPIHLADVLLAIGHAKKNICVESRLGAILEWGANSAGEKAYYEVYRGDGNRKIWNLRNDSLDQQSPECLEFIANLLKS